MRTISVQDLESSPDLFRELADVLHDGGLVCFPTGRQYGVAASLMSEDAVIRLVQSKRRAKRAPSLVFIPNCDALPQVVSEVSPAAQKLVDEFWDYGPAARKRAIEISHEMLARKKKGPPPRRKKNKKDKKPKN